MDENLVQQQGLSSTGHALWVEHEPLLEPQTSQTDQRTTDAVGYPHSWFVDNILIIGQMEQKSTERANKALQFLTKLGIQINRKKSLNQPQQTVTYLGHIWDLKANKIRPQIPK